MQKCFAVDILEKSLNKVEKNIDKSASKKTIVKDIYMSSLNTFYYSQLQVMSDTVSQVKQLVNANYDCSLKDKDIINILYYANEGFMRDLDTMAVSSISKPNNDDMKSSCGKFNICAWKKRGQIGDVSTYGCLPKISDFYDDIQTNKTAVSTLTNRIEGNEYFWNGTLKDSTYDLLVDVYDVAKILFGEEAATQPPEVVFFAMPELSNADGAYNSNNQTTLVDRFSPYNTTVSTNSNTNPGTNSNVGNTSASNLGTNIGGNNAINSQLTIDDGNTSNYSVSNPDSEVIQTNLNDGMDDDIYNFIETVNTLSVESQNVATVSLGNQCVSGFSYQFKTGYTITDTGVSIVYDESDTDVEIQQQPAQEYVAQVLQQIHALQCNNDFVCDSWESTTCEDCIPMASGSTVVSEVEDLLNSLDMEEGDEVSEQTVSCVNKCRQTQISNATDVGSIIGDTLSPEALLLCVAKCFCTTYESKFFDPTKYPGLSPVFKMRFCVIPATQVAKSNEKVVHSIQTVFDVMYDLVSDLKYGGETMPTVKTKTYLDSSYMKNSFAKKISFLITSSSKRHVSKVSKKAKDKNQETFSAETSEALLGQSKDPADLDEKNKYVVAQNPYEGKSEEIEILGEQINKSLQNEMVISADARFSEFMRLNADFWKKIKDILDSFNVQSQQLKNKK